jgi:hypothetical protein
VLLVRNGQLLATLGAAACQYTTTIGSGHSLTETMLVSTATVRGLECSFHSYLLFISFLTMGFGVQNYILFCKRPNLSVLFSCFLPKMLYLCT